MKPRLILALATVVAVMPGPEARAQATRSRGTNFVLSNVDMTSPWLNSARENVSTLKALRVNLLRVELFFGLDAA